MKIKIYIEQKVFLYVTLYVNKVIYFINTFKTQSIKSVIL